MANKAKSTPPVERTNLTVEQVATAEAVMAPTKQATTQVAKTETPPAPIQAETKPKKECPIEALVKKYRKAYPKCSTFYVTSDLQLFLDDGRNSAVLHQNTLKEGELTTVTI